MKLFYGSWTKLLNNVQEVQDAVWVYEEHETMKKSLFLRAAYALTPA